MMTLDVLAWCFVAVLVVPFAWLTIEVAAALLPVRRLAQAVDDRPRVAVLVPAHNEEGGIALTLQQIRDHLHRDDRLLVVADNCTDGTTAVARAAGVEVIERHEAARRGKGFALDYGLRHLAQDPPAVVVVVDADTDVKPWTIDALAAAVAQTGRPVQGVNLLDPPLDAGPPARISAFAFFFKNYVRPRGMDRLGLPCLLYGTGMAMPWSALSQIDLAHGDITEDIRLGVELAVRGTPPAFAPDAHVKGIFPTHSTAAQSQRRRWEHGHLSTIARYVPRLVFLAITRLRLDLLALALHLGVPPLAFLFLFGAIGAIGLAVLHQFTAAAVLAGAMASAILAILAAWLRFGRDRLPARDLLLFPHYVIKKIPIYLGFFFRPQREWVRTNRQK
jgi:cellulose synthase/poly-beta-1,6-N-acetylglucosamine synthase-like glycosyltransferase